MLVATATFAALVALWGSPAVHAVVRDWVERLRSETPDGDPGAAETSAARDASYESPSGRPHAA